MHNLMTRFQDTWSKTDIETTYDLQNLELSRIIGSNLLPPQQIS